ncbi:MAG: type II secretion system major pseudopilin GspG [Pseudohongiellaceae bacterium]
MKLFKKITGFTLIELLVVMAILGMLAALVGPALFGNLLRGQRTQAQTQISNFESALDSYRLDMSRYPDSLEGLIRNDSGRPNWSGPYLRGDRVPLDPWGNDYHYELRSGGRDFTLMSYGADGAPGGQEDDEDIGR